VASSPHPHPPLLPLEPRLIARGRPHGGPVSAYSAGPCGTERTCRSGPLPPQGQTPASANVRLSRAIPCIYWPPLDVEWPRPSKQTVALAPGTSLGHYNVSALLGEGGMGQVWQATDTQLNRQVTLKILPDAFADDPDRLARFQREAQVLASLNHPNIAAIHGIEKSGDTQALVLELVEGPTLADRIAQGPIPIDEALPIAKQIAEARPTSRPPARPLKPSRMRTFAFWRHFRASRWSHSPHGHRMLLILRR